MVNSISIRLVLFLALIMTCSQGWSNAVDCTKLRVQQFKFGKNCIHGSSADKIDKSNTAGNCSIKIAWSDDKNSDQTEITNISNSTDSDVLGLNKDCTVSEGKSERFLNEGCQIHLYFKSLKDYEYRYCTCNNSGCGQLLLKNLGSDEAEKLKDRFVALSKTCKEDLSAKHEFTANGKTSFFVSGKNCYIRAGNTYTEAKYPRISLCMEGPITKEDTLRYQKKYSVFPLGIESSTKIYAAYCQPNVAAESNSGSDEKKTFEQHMREIYNTPFNGKSPPTSK